MKKLLLLILFLTPLFLIQIHFGQQLKALSLKSTSFDNKGNIPAKHAYKTQNISVGLKWSDLPKGTKSIAILMWDKHPIAKKWVHWVVVNIPPSVTEIPEGASQTSKVSNSLELATSFKTKGYGGPWPPEGSGKHEYIITIYALKVKQLKLSGPISQEKFLKAVKGQVIEEQSIIGYFER